MFLKRKLEMLMTFLVSFIQYTNNTQLTVVWKGEEKSLEITNPYILPKFKSTIFGGGLVFKIGSL